MQLSLVQRLTKFLPNTDVKNEQLRTLGSAIYQPDQFEIGTDRDDQRFSQCEAKDELLENIENPFLTVVESGDQWPFTVGRILKKYGLQCRKPHKVPVISQQNKKCDAFSQTKLKAGINKGNKPYGQMRVGFACTSTMVGSTSIVNPKPDMQKESNCNLIAGKLEE